MKVKKYLAVMLLLISALVLFSCRGVKPADSGMGTTVGTDNVPPVAETEKMTEEEAKLEVLRLLTPTARKDDSVRSDGVVHNEFGLSMGITYVRDSIPVVPADQSKIRAYPYVRNYIWRFADGAEPELICHDENCAHDDLSCPAVASEMLFTITDEDTKDTIIYYITDFTPWYIRMGGHTLDLGRELQQYSKWDSNGGAVYVLFEYNMTTGVRRTVSIDLPMMTHFVYYDGKIYVSAMRSADESEKENKETTILYSIDTKTGESVYFGGTGIKDAAVVYFAGIYDGYIYAATRDGVLLKIEPDLSGYESCGSLTDADIFQKNFTVISKINNNACILDLPVHIIDGYLYIEMNCSPDEDGSFTDLYKYKLTGDEPIELVSKNVYGTELAGNYFYYTRKVLLGVDELGSHYDCEPTMYRYDTVSGTEEKVFTLEGAEIWKIWYVDDERIIYFANLMGDAAGIENLADYPELVSILDEREINVSMEYSLKTGAHRVFYRDEKYTPRLEKNK